MNKEVLRVPPPGGAFARRTGICLNMIVKNETAVLERLLRSVKDVVDYFVIVDTGSTDDTPGLIQRLATAWGLPGEIHFRPWVNFGHNRQQALELAVAADRADWLLFIDADEELHCTDPSFFTSLERGVTYRLRKHHGEMRYALTNLVDVRQSRWAWHGPVHEYLACLQGGEPRVTLDEAWIHYHAGQGARSQGVSQREKFLRDAVLLETALHENPDDARNRFYLAQSYRDAGEPAKAHAHYQQRADMGGWVEEAYVARCEQGRMAIALGHAHHDVLRIFMDAWHMRPVRAEALWYAARYCRENKRFAEGYLFALAGKDIARPNDVLFVQQEAYGWRLLDELAVNAYWIGQYRVSEEACQRLLSENRHPAEHRERILANLAFARTGVMGQSLSTAPNRT